MPVVRKIEDVMLGIDPDNYEDSYYSVTEEKRYNDENKKHKLFIYPNPADYRFFVRIKDYSGKYDIHIKIFDLSGKLIMKQNKGCMDYFSVNSDNLKNGIYFIYITDYHSIKESGKLIVHHK